MSLEEAETAFVSDGSRTLLLLKYTLILYDYNKWNAYLSGLISDSEIQRRRSLKRFNEAVYHDFIYS